MATTPVLIQTLSDSLGLERSTVDWTARQLREDGLLPTGRRGPNCAAEVTVQHATNLLLALMAPASPRSIPARVDLYTQLPFEYITRSELMPDGRYEFFPVVGDDPFVDNMRGLGETFGEFLRSYIIAFNEIPEMDTRPGSVLVGGGAGNAFAAVQFFVLADGVDVDASVRFGLTPLGGGRHPDDAAVARLDNYTTVPGSVFQVFRGLLAGDSEGPRDAIMSRARVAELCEGRQ